MKRTAMIATLLALVAVVAFTVPTFAQGPMGGGMMGGNGRGFGFGPTQGITPTVPFNGYGMTLAPHPFGIAGVGGNGMMNGYAPNQTITPTVPFGYGRGGMMNGYGYTPNQTITPTVPFGGMMGGYGMRGGMMGGHGMMSGYGFGQAITLTVKLDDAIARAKQYVAAYNNADLQLAEVEEYTNNYYGVVTEKSTSNAAFQILIDKFNGAVYPEMGPNMMWNTKYLDNVKLGSPRLALSLQTTVRGARTIDQVFNNQVRRLFGRQLRQGHHGLQQFPHVRHRQSR